MVRLPLRAVVSVALAACSTGADPALRDPWTWRDLPEPTPVSLSTAGSLKVTPLGTFGSDAGAGMLGAITAVAATDHELFVFDRSTCEVVVFARSTRTVTRRFGQCGRGPTDMEFATSMTIVNDTLILADRQGLSLSLWSTAGNPLRTSRFSLSDSASSRTISVSPVGPDRLGITVEILPNGGSRNGRIYRAQGAAHFRVIDYFGRQVEPGLFVDGDGPERQTQGLFRSLLTCASKDRRGAPYVASMSMWVPQLSIVSLESAVHAIRMNVLLTDLPLRPQKSERTPNSYNQGGFTRAACDPEKVVASVTMDSTGAELDRTLTLVAVDLLQHKLYATRAKRQDTEWFGIVSAIHGQSAFIVQHTVADYPRVYEVRLDLRDVDQTSSAARL